MTNINDFEPLSLETVDGVTADVDRTILSVEY